MVGGIFGGVIAYGLFDGRQAATIAGGLQQVAFQFAVTPSLLVLALVVALIMGFLGGLFPAMKAVWGVIAFNIKSLPARFGSAMVIVTGIAVVAAVLCGALAIAEGYRQAFASMGEADVALIVSEGSKLELTSGLSREEINAIAQAPGIAQGESGPLVATDLLATLNVHFRKRDLGARILLRGIDENFRILHPKVKLVAGRWFKPGNAEIVVGAAAAARFEHLAPGDRITSAGKAWQVVGVFAASGSAFGSEAWTGLGDVQGLRGRGAAYSAARVQLASPVAFDPFKQVLMRDPRLRVTVMPERDFYAAQSSGLSTIISVAGGVAALLSGIAANFGAMGTLYTAVANRTREIVTLRVLGFRRPGLPPRGRPVSVIGDARMSRISTLSLFPNFHQEEPKHVRSANQAVAHS